MMDEIWKDVPKIYGNYEVSNKGNVRHKKLKLNKTLLVNKGGYVEIRLHQGKKSSRTVKVHRLVAVSFIPNPYNYPLVNHINGIKSDNRVENLEWCTPLQNTRHAIENGLLNIEKIKQHNIERNSEKVWQFDLNKKFIKEFNSITEAANEVGIHKSRISDALSGRQHIAGGYYWVLSEFRKPKKRTIYF